MTRASRPVPGTLIKEGVIAGFLQNRETAAELGAASNGAARSSSYDREPIIRMANTYMKPGDHHIRRVDRRRQAWGLHEELHGVEY